MKIAADYKPFWRAEPLSGNDVELLNALFAMHDVCTRRNNVSSVVLVNTALGSGEYEKAVAAAILTTGGKHAPLLECFDHLDKWICSQAPVVVDGRVPGWGNDFVKGEMDPALSEIAEALPYWGDFGKDIQRAIEETTKALHERGKIIFPNPGCYTAAVGIALGVPRFVLPFLFIAARLSAWSELILLNLPKE